MRWRPGEAIVRREVWRGRPFRRWWDDAWTSWRPDPSWPLPELPEGWADAR